MTRYLIKATYQTGKFAGQSYLLEKGGYPVRDLKYQWERTTYKSRGIAERICRNLAEYNRMCYESERSDEKRRIEKGLPASDFFIYEIETYEPYPIENVMADIEFDW